MNLTNTPTYCTREYNLFRYANGNRNVNPKHVKEIIKSIENYGLKPTIIVVNEKMEIIDGQHRLEALKALNLPVYYQIYKGLKIKDCIAMNTTSKKWNFRDYIHSHASQGNTNYQKVERLMQMFPKLSLVAIITTLTNKSWGSMSNKSLIEGELKVVVTESKAIEKLKVVQQVLDNFKDIGGRKELLVISLVRLLDLGVVETKRLIEQTKTYAQVATGFIDIIGSVAQIENVYNYRRQNKVRFVSLYQQEYIDKGENK